MRFLFLSLIAFALNANANNSELGNTGKPGIAVQQLLDIMQACLGAKVSAGDVVAPNSLMAHFASDLHQVDASFPLANQPGFYGSVGGSAFGYGCDSKNHLYFAEGDGALPWMLGISLYTGEVDLVGAYEFAVDRNKLIYVEAAHSNPATNLVLTPSTPVPPFFNATCAPLTHDSLGNPEPRRLSALNIPMAAHGRNIIHFRNGGVKTAITMDWNRYTNCMHTQLQN